MNEILTIKEFGPIKDITLEIKRYTVFIGSQASGKSTVAKLLAIFRNPDMYTKEEVSYGDLNEYFLLYNIDEYFHSSTYLCYVCPNYKIEYSSGYLRVTKNEDFQNKLKKRYDEIVSFADKFVNETSSLKDSSSEDKLVFLRLIIDANWPASIDESNQQVYIPAERILVSIIKESSFSFQESSLPGCLIEFGKKFEAATASLKSYKVDFINITYKKESNGHRIYPTDDLKSLALSSSASGIQSLLPLILVVEHTHNQKTKGKHTYIVEEPELNLFPSTQKSVLDFILTKSNDNQKKDDVVITTHSPYILSIINNYLLSYKVSSLITDKEILKRLSDIYPPQTWINPDEFVAYYINEGTSTKIYNEQTKQISDNELDAISEDLNDDFSSIIEIYKTELKKNKNVSKD